MTEKSDGFEMPVANLAATNWSGARSSPDASEPANTPDRHAKRLGPLDRPAPAEAQVHPAVKDFDEFYRSSRDRIGRTLALTLNDQSLGFEATDEAMARAYERWAKVSVYENIDGWVYRTGLNWARSWLRRRKRAGDKAPLVAQSEAVSDMEIDVDLADALAKLNDDHRAVVVLRFYNDWTVEQTAAALDIAPGTVKSRLSRALRVLNGEL